MDRYLDSIGRSGFRLVMHIQCNGSLAKPTFNSSHVWINKSTIISGWQDLSMLVILARLTLISASKWDIITLRNASQWQLFSNLLRYCILSWLSLGYLSVILDVFFSKHMSKNIVSENTPNWVTDYQHMNHTSNPYQDSSKLIGS